MPYSRTQMEHPPTKMQVWIDRLRFVLGVVAIIAIAVTFVLNNQADVAQNERITKIESPCLRYGPESRECRRTFGAAIKSINDYQLCILLSKRPDLTGVDPAECARIAREAKRKQSGNSLPGDADSAVSVPPANSPPADSNAPGVGNAPKDGTERKPQPPKHHPAPTPAPTPAPSPAPEPAPGNSGESPGHTGENPGQGGGPPPGQAGGQGAAVGVEAPVLPVEVCLPGVASVNCKP